MKSFKDYQPSSTKAQNEVNANKTSAEKLTEDIVKAWQGKPNRDVLSEILKEARQSKLNGTLTNEELDEFYNNFQAMLSPVQKKALKNVVDRLKNV